MLNTHIYVFELEQHVQDYIYNYVDEFLTYEGHSLDVRTKALAEVMDEKLCNISHVLDMDELEGIING